MVKIKFDYGYSYPSYDEATVIKTEAIQIWPYYLCFVHFPGVDCSLDGWFYPDQVYVNEGKSKLEEEEEHFGVQS